MSRKAKGPGFTPRSGKSPIFKTMGGSPVKVTGEETTVSGDYATTVEKFSNFEGTEKEVRAAVIANNKGKAASDKSRIPMNRALQLWRKGSTPPKTPPVVESSKVVTEPTEVVEEEEKRYHGAAGAIVDKKGKEVGHLLKDVVGVMPEHDDPDWEYRQASPPGEKPSNPKYASRQEELDATINIRRPAPTTPITKKAPRGFRMAGWGKKNT